MQTTATTTAAKISDASINALATTAVETAAKACRAYLDAHGLKASTDALLSCLRANVKIRFAKAMADAQEALAANMPEVAGQTFAAEMALAGIDAAKEAALPPAARPEFEIRTLKPSPSMCQDVVPFAGTYAQAVEAARAAYARTGRPSSVYGRTSTTAWYHVDATGEVDRNTNSGVELLRPRAR